MDINEKLIDKCVERYISDNLNKLKTGNDAKKEFDEVRETLNVDNAFCFKTKTFKNIPAYYMYSSKSKTLLQVYFGIKEDAGHIELSVKELMENYSDKEDTKMDTNTLIENVMILNRAKTLIEAACEGCEDLKDVKESLSDAIEKIDEVIDDCGCEKKGKDDDKVSDKTKEVVDECILRLYEKASLCESVEDASVYINKATELQKAIDDIPEESPVNDDDYPADDVTGGEGEAPSDDDIKDLVGDEGIKILMDDNGSVTVD